MASKKPKMVLYRRRREQKTDYKKRLKLLLASKPRLVVRFTNQKIIAQIVQFKGEGDQVIVAVDSFTLRKYGWKQSCKNISAAYLTGLLIGQKAAEKDVAEAILDTGYKTPLKKGKIYAFLKGAVDSELEVPHGEEEIFPDEERIKGQALKNPSEAVKEFEKVKKMIMEKKK